MIIYITGGQRSGKSKFAESLVLDKARDKVAYMATSKVEDSEMEERVKKHRQSRPQEWRTIEAYRGLAKTLGEEDYYILECVGTMTSNILFDHSKDLEEISDQVQGQVEGEILRELKKLIDKIQEQDKTLILVSNEVGSSITSQYQLVRVYTDVLGRVNQELARLADQAYLVVSGIEMRLK